jgi:hypothetical protein
MFACQPNYPAVRDSTSANLSSSQLAPEDEREAQRVEMEADDKEIQKKESQVRVLVSCALFSLPC